MILFFVASGVVFIINLLGNKKMTGGEEKYTFFIHASHIFILPFVKMLLQRISSWITGAPTVNDIGFANQYPFLVIIEYISSIVVTIVVTMGIYNVMERLLPRTCKILCGR